MHQQLLQYQVSMITFGHLEMSDLKSLVKYSVAHYSAAAARHRVAVIVAQ